MQVDHPLRLVTPTVDGDVLAALARAEAEFTPPQLHRVLGEHSESGVRNALRRLATQGIVTTRQVGRATTYALNREHLAAAAITDLARLRDTLVRRLAELLDGWDQSAAYAALFGSTAAGSMRTDSDLDLFVVRAHEVEVTDDRWRDQLDELARASSSWTGNDARVLEYSEAEVEVGSREGDVVLADIGREGIRLAGPPAYLRRRQRRRA